MLRGSFESDVQNVAGCSVVWRDNWGNRKGFISVFAVYLGVRSTV